MNKGDKKKNLVDEGKSAVKSISNKAIKLVSKGSIKLAPKHNL